MKQSLKTLLQAGVVAGFSTLQAMTANAQDLSLNLEIVQKLTDACGVSYSSYLPGGPQDHTNINRYGEACHEATQDSLRDFMIAEIRPQIAGWPKKGETNIEARQRGVAVGELNRVCNYHFNALDMDDVLEGAITPDFTGGYYEAIGAYSNCTNIMHAHGIPDDRINDFNVLALHVSCMNDAGEASQAQRNKCGQLEQMKSRVTGVPFENKL